MQIGPYACLIVALSLVIVLSPTIDAANVIFDPCKFSILRMSCYPADKCSFQPKFGDITPSQSCRDIVRTVGTNPEQFHLAYAGESAGTGMTITWTTLIKVDKPMVWIGTNPESMTQANVNVSIISYYKDWTYTLFTYHATILDLEPHTMYYYRVGDATIKSATKHFTTARATNDFSSFSIGIYGDFGLTENSLPTLKYLKKEFTPFKVDFVLHLGDISYADNAGILTGTQIVGFFYEEAYNAFMRAMTPLMSVVPYMTLPGNHESECHSLICMTSLSKQHQLGNYRAYNARFKMPSQESGGAQNMWYSFDHGPIHFTSISSETDFKGSPKNSVLFRTYGGFGNQLEWLEQDLKKANVAREKTPWLIVSMHSPIYTHTMCNNDGAPIKGAAALQAAFEDLFIKYKVDLVLSGHAHLYQRTFPTMRNVPIMDGVSEDHQTYTDPQAPVYVISGAAGSNEGHKEYDDDKKIKWCATINNKRYGVSKLTVVNKSEIKLQFIGVKRGKVLDSFTIKKTK